MSNEEIIKWVETIKYNIEHINLDDPKDFNDLKNCCDDLIDHIQNPNVNDNSYENWKIPE